MIKSNHGFNILIRCDGSSEIGMGHVTRCLALANDLVSNWNSSVIFAMHSHELGVEKIKKIFPVIVKDKTENFTDVEWIIGIVKEKKVEALVLDVRHQLCKDDLIKIKQGTDVVIASVDDPEDKRLVCDLVFYPPIVQVKEMNWQQFKGRLFTGWNYVSIAKEFIVSQGGNKRGCCKIMVSMGSTDPLNMTASVIEALTYLNANFHAYIILGKGNKNLSRIKSDLSQAKFSYMLIEDPASMRDYMLASDFAVIAFGHTAYELAAVGVHTLILSLTDDHYRSALVFEEFDLGTSLGVYENTTLDQIVEGLKELISLPSNNSKRIHFEPSIGTEIINYISNEKGLHR
jgi:spore coat polysaccharide biosynthesis predicted glycosyltransferase SpsG